MDQIREKIHVKLISNHLWMCGVWVQYPLIPVQLRRVLPLERERGKLTVPTRTLKFKKRKEDQKEKDIVVIEDPKSLVAKGEMIFAKQKVQVFESDDVESNLLEIIGREDGIKKIGEMWLTYVEVDIIENY